MLLPNTPPASNYLLFMESMRTFLLLVLEKAMSAIISAHPHHVAIKTKAGFVSPQRD